ncbi:hypothetical protein F5B18DRAFT_209472 [Nemania serpens]|nr:hypothetical protein F5B18DRAFT_209472 [Nemania serpens]
MAKWAVLVGISSYPNAPRGNSFEEVRACVQDVKDIRDVLCSQWGFEPENVITLTSPPLDAHPPQHTGAEEDYSCLPSYENMLDILSSTLSQASAGDVVYLHFSAATARVDCMFPPIRTTPITASWDDTILPYDFFLNRKCLPDLEIAFLVRKHVARQVEITLVIDGRKRSTSPGNVIIRSAQEDLRSVFQGIWSQKGYQTWLQNPEPHETFAHIWLSLEKEYFDDDSQTWHGSLTYFLLRYLRSTTSLNYTYRTFMMYLGGSLASRYAPSLAVDAAALVVWGCMETLFLGGIGSSFPQMTLSLTEYQYLEGLNEGNLLQQSMKAPLSSPYSQDIVLAHDNPNSAAENVSNNGNVCFRLVLTPDQHASLYRDYVSLRYFAPALLDGIEVFLLGAYGGDGDKYPRVPRFSEGILHLVSGDHALIRVASLLGQQAFVRVLCFDSSFGVFQVYPMKNTSKPEIQAYPYPDDDLSADPYKQVHPVQEVIIHLQLFLPSRSCRSKQPIQATEALKVIVSSEPFHNERAIEMPPIRDESYLMDHPDPVLSFLLNGRKSSQTANGIDARLIEPDSGETQVGFLEDMHSTANLARSSYTISYVLHRDGASPNTKRRK